MSETTYYAIYIGINIACTVCTIVGQVYINSKATPPGRKDSGNCVGINCFMAGTLVLTAEGYKKIEDIQVGDLVLAYDEATGEQAYKEVVRLFRNENTEWTGVTVNGTEIISTTGHKYYLPEAKEWISATKLKVGTKVLLSDGSYGTIEKVRDIHYDTPQTTYNFEVEDFHTYYVSTGVLVHNMNGVPCGVGGKGWEGDAIWRENVQTVSKGGTIEELKGGIPTKEQGIKLINQAKGQIVRIDPPHLPPNPHNYPHINYITQFGNKGTLRIV